MQSGYINLPPSWTLKSDTSTGYNLVKVGKGKKKAIREIVQETFDPDKVGVGADAINQRHSKITVTDIKRIENPKLFQSYIVQKNMMKEKEEHGHRYENIQVNPGKLNNFNVVERSRELNEKYLFHGTDKEAAESIAKEGFDPLKTNPRSLFGQGIYFTEDFTKADQYADEKTNRRPDGTELTVILCRVLLGNALRCHRDDAKKLKHPPCMECEHEICSCGKQKRYNSVLGSGMQFREFVVYDGSQCYPEYVITYKRGGRKKKRKNRKQTITTSEQAYVEVETRHANDENFSPVSKLNEFHQKVKTDRPKYEFDTQACRWTCTVQFEERTCTAQEDRRKIAKRSAAGHMWAMLKSEVQV